METQIEKQPQIARMTAATPCRIKDTDGASLQFEREEEAAWKTGSDAGLPWRRKPPPLEAQPTVKRHGRKVAGRTILSEMVAVVSRARLDFGNDFWFIKVL